MCPVSISSQRCISCSAVGDGVHVSYTSCPASPDGGCGCAVLKLVLSWASLSHYWLMYQEQPSQQLCCGRSHLFSFLHARIFTRQVSVVLTGVPWDAL
jgi:hypothetical protein